MNANQWDKASIHRLLDTNPKAVVRALIAIAAYQTADELNSHHTKHANGVGFSSYDAPFLTDMLRQINAGRTLSPKQMAVTTNKVKRYWRQLAEIANASSVKPIIGESQGEAVAGVLQNAVAKKGREDRSAAEDALHSLDCECENYDGERRCNACERRFGYREIEGSW